MNHELMKETRCDEIFSIYLISVLKNPLFGGFLFIHEMVRMLFETNCGKKTNNKDRPDLCLNVMPIGTDWESHFAL